ncbi:15884_t:CDS:2 [Acaulospora morrowiae]|uniref:15884_t:CDS:1 n=1 Tax=Acaulospora morrowiae TaxID=94023 RepID=A0A9N9J834_9GLOM|nr:15884_t:CDS:2 [Acaulospora morrowiae]
MAGTNFPTPSRGYVFMSKLLGGRMLYRGKKEAPIVLGLRHPWEHSDHENGHSENNETH